jgi:hypothetical protein
MVDQTRSLVSESREIMGYRSEVALALTGDAANVLRELCEHQPVLKELMNDNVDNHGWDSSDPDFDRPVKLRWSGVKWYEDYLEIRMLQAFMNETDEEEWLFLRIGEESDDTEEQGQFWESDMYIERSIVL